MNRARLLQLGFELGARALGGRSQGAWFATAPDGAPIVLKWSPDETIADASYRVGINIPLERTILPLST